MSFTVTTPETARTESEHISYATFQRLAPEIVASLRAITQAVKVSSLEPELVELVKIRASQINGCAFCIQFHLNDARKLNISVAKLDLLAAWRDAGLYSEREMAALEWTEALTRQSQQHIEDKLYTEVSHLFSEQEFVVLTAAIGQINFWNRIAAPFRFAPPVPPSTQEGTR